MSRPRILIVEDEPFTALEERSILRGLGYEVVGIASSGDEAVKSAEESRPDLILMDIKLAGKMDGWEATLKIQELHQIPVLYVTAYEDQETSKSLETPSPAGIGYIVKPFTVEELESEVKRLIRLASD